MRHETPELNTNLPTLSPPPPPPPQPLQLPEFLSGILKLRNRLRDGSTLSQEAKHAF